MGREHDGRWSYSRVSCFAHCKYEFYLEYVIADDDEYLSEGNYYAEVGSFVHEILAMIFTGELKAEDALDYFIDHYDDNVCYKVSRSTMDKTFGLIADYFAEADFDWIKDYEVLGAELKAKFKVDDYDFIGFIDLLLRDKRDGRIVVLDHKSSEYPFRLDGKVKANSQKNFESYKRQMYLYCHAVKQLYGEYPKEIIWNHFKDGGRLAVIPFAEKEYEKTMQWFRSTLRDIEKEEAFEPTEEFCYCKNLCNFRNSCEYRQVSSSIL